AGAESGERGLALVGTHWGEGPAEQKGRQRRGPRRDDDQDQDDGEPRLVGAEQPEHPAEVRAADGRVGRPLGLLVGAEGRSPPVAPKLSSGHRQQGSPGAWCCAARGYDPPVVQRYVLAELDSGMRVVTERVRGVRSVAIGFWIGAGSRDERNAKAGASHFIEHLLFKGSSNYSAHD